MEKVITKTLRRRLLAFAALQVPFLLLSCIFAYRHLFAWFPLHDDEGYVMMSVRYLLRGRRMYDEVPILFGPAFFLYKWIVHGVLQVPLTHDAIRFELLVLWLVAVLVSGSFVVVLVSSVALALAAQFAVLSLLIMLSNEPGHPQELIVLVVVVSLILSLAHRRRPLLTMLLLGVSAAVVLGLKVNLGMFAVVALGAAAATNMRPTATLLALRGGAVLLFVVLPWFVLGVRNDWSEWAVRYAGVVSVSAVPVALILWRDHSGRSGWSEVGAIGVGFALAAAAFVLFALERGSSTAAMFESLWVMPQRLTSSTPPVPIGIWSIALASAVLGLALPSLLSYRPARVCLFLLKAAFGILVLVPRIPIQSVLLLDHAMPWVWLSLLPLHEEGGGVDFPRKFLATNAVLLSMWGYPVPGSQLAFSTLLLAISAAIAAGDAAIAARAVFPRVLGRPTVRASALVAVLLLVGRQTLRLENLATESYDTSIPLALPGATRLRLDPRVVTLFTHLARALREAPDTFVCTDGFYSMYFWTDKEPPSPILIAHPMDIYAPEQLDALTEALLSRPDARLVLNQGLPEFRSQYAKPFYQNLFRFFAEEKRIGPFVIEARRTG